MRKTRFFKHIYLCIGYLITGYHATSQIDSALKSTAPVTVISTQVKAPPLKATIMPSKYYQDFYKDITLFQKIQVPAYRTTAPSVKKNTHPVLNIVGSVLLGVLGEKTNHSYYSPNN